MAERVRLEGRFDDPERARELREGLRTGDVERDWSETKSISPEAGLLAFAMALASGLGTVACDGGDASEPDAGMFDASMADAAPAEAGISDGGRDGEPPVGRGALRVLSSRADMVTGGDVLLYLGWSDVDTTLRVDGTAHPVTWHPYGEGLLTLVSDLPLGPIVLESSAGDVLPIENHPRQGPVFSAPTRRLASGGRGEAPLRRLLARGREATRRARDHRQE